MKKKNKEIISFWVMLISTIIIVFNNVGQSFTLIDIPFSRNSQFWVGGFSFFVGAIWTLYLRRIIK